MSNIDELIAEESERQFLRPMLLPVAMSYSCPDCGKGPGDPVDTKEDDTGRWSVPDDQRFIECECGALLDIGWEGWFWHDERQTNDPLKSKEGSRG